MRRTTVVALLGVACCACGPRIPPTELPQTTGVSHAGEASSLEALLDAAARADGVCIGEQHDDPAHHRMQLAVLEGVVRRAPEAPWAVGFEMFGRSVQPVLDRFRGGEIDAATLRRESDWDERWGFGFAMYAPLLEAGRQRGLGLLALNAPRELTRAIAREGLENLTTEDRTSLPELDLGNAAHRRFFFTIMGFDDPDGAHTGTHGGMNPEHFYAAQVTWDETMAETAASWLQKPERKVVVIAGNGHCHRVAIPDRIERRRPGRSIVSILLRTGGASMPAGMTGDWLVTLPDSTSAADDDGPAATSHPIRRIGGRVSDGG